jgi:hypothetical protein
LNALCLSFPESRHFLNTFPSGVVDKTRLNVYVSLNHYAILDMSASLRAHSAPLTPSTSIAPDGSSVVSFAPAAPARPRIATFDQFGAAFWRFGRLVLLCAPDRLADLESVWAQLMRWLGAGYPLDAVVTYLETLRYSRQGLPARPLVEVDHTVFHSVLGPRLLAASPAPLPAPPRRAPGMGLPAHQFAPGAEPRAAAAFRSPAADALRGVCDQKRLCFKFQLGKCAESASPHPIISRGVSIFVTHACGHCGGPHPASSCP